MARLSNSPSQGSIAQKPDYSPLLPLLVAVAAGIVLDRYRPLGLGVWLAIAIMNWAIWRALWPLEGRLFRGRRTSVWPLLVSIAAVAGAWHHWHWNLRGQYDIARFATREAQPVAMHAVVTRGARMMPAPPRDPLRTMPLDDRTRVELRVLAVRDQREWREASGLATLVIAGRDTRPVAGDRLTLFAQLRAAPAPDNPGQFDIAAFARSAGHGAALAAEHADCLTLVEAAPRRWNWQQALDGWRSENRELLAEYLSPRVAGLAGAMFVGIREDIQPEDFQAFFETGTVHLLVVSGANVGVLAAGLMLAGRIAGVRRRPMLAATAIVCLLFAFETDLQAPVTRATVMVLAGCGAAWLGRGALDINSLGLAAIVILAINPTDLFAIGPQLSFLAVATLVWRAQKRRLRAADIDPLARLIEQNRPWPERLARRLGSGVWQALIESAVICAVVAPLVVARFHLLSLVAIVLGPILAAPVALGMISGFVLLITGGWLTPVAVASAWVCEGCLRFIQMCVAWGQWLPGGHWWIPGPSDWWLAGFYVGLVGWALLQRREHWKNIELERERGGGNGGRASNANALGQRVQQPGHEPLRHRSRPPLRWGVGLFCAWLFIGIAAGWIARRLEPRLLRCTNLAIGHGTAVVLELPDGRTLVYDAGRLGSPQAASEAMAGYLWSRGITHLDAVVLSHADADHYNALPALARQFSIGVVYASPVMFDDMTPGLTALRHAIDVAGAPIREVWAPDRLDGGPDCTIEILHPPRLGLLASDNANSIVLAVEHAGRRLLLTGDLESPGLDSVLAEEPWDCDVLVAPHHGSMYSAPSKMAAWCRPEWTIISGSSRDEHAMVDEAYEKYGEVRHTAREGAVQATLSREHVELRSWRRLIAAGQGGF